MSALRMALTPPVIIRSLSVTFIVGVILNVINQGDVALSGGPIEWRKVALTFVVPFLVSTFAAYGASRDRDSIDAQSGHHR